MQQRIVKTYKHARRNGRVLYYIIVYSRRHENTSRVQKPDCAVREKRLKQIVVDFRRTYRRYKKQQTKFCHNIEVVLIIFFECELILQTKIFENDNRYYIFNRIHRQYFINHIVQQVYNKSKVLFVIIINSTIEMINGRSNQMITFFPQFRDTRTSKPKILFVGGLFVSTTILLNYYSSSSAQYTDCCTVL